MVFVIQENFPNFVVLSISRHIFKKCFRTSFVENVVVFRTGGNAILVHIPHHTSVGIGAFVSVQVIPQPSTR